MRQNDPAPVAIEFSLFKAGARIANPTIALNDAKIAIGGAGQVNTVNIPTTDGAGKVSWQPTQAETDAFIVTFFMLDVIGAQWEPITIYFDTRTETAVWLYLDAAISTRSTLTQANILSDATPFPGASIDAAISTRAVPGSAMALTGAERTATAGVIWATLLEGAHTVADGLRIMLAALAGRSTGGGTFTNRFRDVANTKNRIAATVDANGNRTAITTLDGTP